MMTATPKSRIDAVAELGTEADPSEPYSSSEPLAWVVDSLGGIPAGYRLTSAWCDMATTPSGRYAISTRSSCDSVPGVLCHSTQEMSRA